MIPKIEYYRFKDLREVLEFLYGNPGSKVMSGGTDLVVQLRSGKVKARKIVDISGLSGLRYIVEDERHVRIGALTTIEDLKNNPIVMRWAPPLWSASRSFATWQVRNMATIGGNLCNASPAADTAPPLIVLKSSIKLVSLETERTMMVEEFFKGPGETAAREFELLTEVMIPKHADGWRFSFHKLGRRMSHVLSIVSVAAGLRLEGGKIADVVVALGSVAPTPVRSRSVENYLRGREASEENIEKASFEVVKDIKPISDVRASADYRTEMSKVLVKRALRECLPEEGTRSPP